LQGKEDAIVGMVVIDPSIYDHDILVISEKGNGKRSEVDEYRLTRRGAKGVKAMSITQKTGKLVAIKAVKEEYDLMITTKDGVVIRTSIADIRVMGRATQGVKIIRLDDQSEIADVALVRDTNDEEE